MIQATLRTLSMQSVRVLSHEASTSSLFLHKRAAILAMRTKERTMSSTSDDVVHVTRPSPHVALITLRNHPVNALSSRMVTQLEEALASIESSSGSDHDAARCVVLASGLDRVFCAGADLKERAGMSQSETRDFVTRLRRLTVRISSLPQVSIAAIHGHALGGGLELALSCDVRVAMPDARMALPEVQLGIIPGAGGTSRLKALIGDSRAKMMICTGRRMTGRDAFRLGVVDELATSHDEEEEDHDDDADREDRDQDNGNGKEKMMRCAFRLAEEIARNAPLALRAAKVPTLSFFA